MKVAVCAMNLCIVVCHNKFVNLIVSVPFHESMMWTWLYVPCHNEQHSFIKCLTYGLTTSSISPLFCEMMCCTSSYVLFVSGIPFHSSTWSPGSTKVKGHHKDLTHSIHKFFLNCSGRKWFWLLNTLSNRNNKFFILECCPNLCYSKW